MNRNKEIEGEIEKVMKPLGMYIHIPFCKKKCQYCDFISYENQMEWVEEYVTCLKKEIEQVGRCNQLDEKQGIDERIEIQTIYIGGGTPSYIKETYITEILETIRKNFLIQSDAEITIEVNPGTVNKQKLEQYKQAGVNRLSIGVQSTKKETLALLGRIHSYEEFCQVYQWAREVGFTNINVDLMLGVPNQTLEEMEENLEKIISLNPEHISVYSLIVEENTRLQERIEKGEFNLPSEELERKMYWLVKDTLEEAGWQHYEISNFAKQGYESKHNMDCWNQKEYMGFGVAAHSYTNGVRYSNIEKIEDYINNIKEDKPENNFIFHEKQTHHSKLQEYMMLGLRKMEGVNIQEFIQKFQGNPMFIFQKELDKLQKQELIEIGDDIKLTSKGIDLANLVWEEFV